MITGVIQSKVDRILDTQCSGGTSHPLTIMKRLALLADEIAKGRNNWEGLLP